MRKYNFILGFLCGACIFGGTAVLANTDVLARITSQVFFWNNERIELEAYNINDYNYVRLRDAAKIFDVNIEYDENTDSVYMGETPAGSSLTPTVTTIDGTVYAREDFSRLANPDIFNETYTREAYNAIRQSIVDIDLITAGTDENGYNPNYRYAHFIDLGHSFERQGETITAMNSVGASLFGYYTFSLGQEPGIKNLYEYPGYRICKPQVHAFFEPANIATEDFISSLVGLSDTEKVKRIETYICDRIVYKDEDTAGINLIFTSKTPVNGICGTYSDAFVYLCQRAEIPCIGVRDDIHAWNEVYVDGKWRTTDVSYYDVARTDEMLFQDNYHRNDSNPAGTKFAKELLVPMSTK